MPATEQTWRDSKLMHLIFGISSLAMLATTIWMLAADHRREWKDYQRTFQSIETWTAQARIGQQESEQYHQELKQADDALQTARAEIPDGKLLDAFEDAARQDAATRHEEPNFTAIDNAWTALKQGDASSRPALRERFREDLATFTAQARFRENHAASEKKFLAANLDVARSQYELGVGRELSKPQLDAMQATVTDILAKMAQANLAVEGAMTYRKRLESIVAEMTADETQAAKQLDDLRNKLVQLEKALYERENSTMKEFVELPIMDAFGRPIKIEQIWLPKLTINYNFRDVARFDRCTSCHQAIDKTAPGSAVEPGFRPLQTVVLSLETPTAAPEALQDKPLDLKAVEALYARLLQEVYGFQVARQGLVDPAEAVVSVVRPETPAARAEIEVGDCLVAINDVKILDRAKAFSLLLESVHWGQPLKLTVRRGLPNPYASHPRLDLFVGSLSPHKLTDIGCTICHDGQGSATAFKWASHSPDDVFQADQWKRELGWFDNHHWIFPMVPKRFAQSLCLKCHHDVTELEPSERFRDPPAPKLVEGFRLIQQFGCFGCHEINGFDGPNRRIGPDLRAEPNYAAAAEALLAGGELSEQQRAWANDLVRDPDQQTARHALSESLKSAASLPGDPNVTKKLVNLLDDVESPGTLRKTGPSLRHVASKVGFDFLYAWVRKPSDFRPSTKMPQFFGLDSHLDGEGLKATRRFEPLEIRGVVEYLLAKSQPFEFTAPPKSEVESRLKATAKPGSEKFPFALPSAERGKLAFETRCLACHQHSDFPAGKMTQGPDLSRIGAKLTTNDNRDGPKWLYSWLRNPSKYHARTLMPNMMLDAVAGADGKLTDPAMDIATFLLGSRQDWQPKDVPGRELSEADQQALEDLALEHLKSVFPKRQAEAYLQSGIPEDRRSELKGDEVELVGQMSIDKKLRFVGRRTISKYGCSGCHDIPGFEDTKSIGTGLADWGRKTPDRLAFEQIVEYFKHGHGTPGPLVHPIGAQGDVKDTRIEEADTGAYGHTHLSFLDLPPDAGYFMEKLFGHERQGFIWQKLREPRSYDFKKTQNKGYNERLRMPQFTGLNDAQRESIITFVLGLVAEPPAREYVYRPTPRRDAIVQGLQVIEKFNCTGCHALSMERWDLAYAPGDFADPSEIVDFPFLAPHFSPQEIKASLATDSRGLRHATVTGMPAVDEEGKPLRIDEEGSPIDPEDKETKGFYSFVLWDNVLVNGKPRPAGLQNLLIPESRIEKRYEPTGGFLARTAFPVVVVEEKKLNSNVKADEAWGWLPPPLAGEGRKVQTAWLHDFLLDPRPIRPATVLRMPKFNMSPAEATKLVNYFAAVDGVDYPYDFDPRTGESHVASQEARHPDRWNDALKIITDNNYCIKCHAIGDIPPPTGSERAKGPPLDIGYKRMRPDFLHAWIGNPKRILPYTGMPVNVPFDKPVSQSLYKGTSEEQLNAVVDLLLNYDRFMESKTSIKSSIKPPPPAAAEKQSADAQSQAAAQ
jgi:hypothetical protein